MRSARHPLVFLVAVALVAGCAGNDRPQASVDPAADLGSIGGLIIDDEQRGIGFADVQLVGLEFRERADGGGRFVFLRVPPGEYVVRASANGFITGEQRVELEPGQDAIIRIELDIVPPPVAFYVTDHHTAHHACMIYTFVYVTHCSAPYTTLYETLERQGADPSGYGAPPDVLENTYRHNFTVDANSTGIVSELVWAPNADATRYMWFVLSCAWYDPVSDACMPPDATAAVPPYAGKRGPSPLRIQWEHPNPQWLPWVMAKARVTGDIDQYVGASIDQRLDMYNTVFYGGPVPQDWTILTEA